MSKPRLVLARGKGVLLVSDEVENPLEKKVGFQGISVVNLSNQSIAVIEYGLRYLEVNPRTSLFQMLKPGEPLDLIPSRADWENSLSEPAQVDYRAILAEIEFRGAYNVSTEFYMAFEDGNTLQLLTFNLYLVEQGFAVKRS